MPTRGDTTGDSLNRLWSDSPRQDPASAPGYTLPQRTTSRWLATWYAITAPVEPPANAPFRTRERARRGRLLSVIFLGFGLILAGAFYQYLVVDDDHPLMVAVLGVVLVVAVIATAVNRMGYVTLAGILTVLVAEAPLAGPFAATKDGQLDVLHLGAFYLTVGALLVAASVLSPWSVFPVAALNSAASLLIVATRPHTPALASLLASSDGQQAFLGPIVMQLIVAIIAYLWAQNTLSAMRRADRAEEIAALERREVVRQRELDEGVRQLLAVHVALANGDFTARVAPLRSQLLWQVGRSLNTLVGRMVRYAQAEVMLRREQDEAQRLAQTLLHSPAGQPIHWPRPSGLPIDVVIAVLSAHEAQRGVDSPQESGSDAVEKQPVAWADMTWPASHGAGNPNSRPVSDPRAELPEWLQP